MIRLFRWAVVAWILVVAFTPITRLEVLCVQLIVLAFALGLAGVNAGRAMSKWQSSIITLGFLSLFVAMGHPLRGRLGMLPIMEGIVVKNAVLLGTVAALVEKLGSIRLVDELKNMGLPAEIVTTVSLMSRYVPMLGGQLQRMRRARESRMVRSSMPGLWLVQSGGLATLLVRSLERAERLHDAMMARGWQPGVQITEKNGILAEPTTSQGVTASQTKPRND
ncbi:MAG: energy-coupling factor transporter transmembrane component T family protein [bacterium]